MDFILNEDKIIKLTKDNKGEPIHGVGREFLKKTQKALVIQGKIEFTKITEMHTARGMNRQNHRKEYIYNTYI